MYAFALYWQFLISLFYKGRNEIKTHKEAVKYSRTEIRSKHINQRKLQGEKAYETCRILIILLSHYTDRIHQPKYQTNSIKILNQSQTV